MLVRSPVGQAAEMKATRGSGHSSEHGFSMVEMVTVIVFITLLIAVAVVAYYATFRRTDVKAAAEMLKTNIMKTYALADSGVKHGDPDDPNEYKRDKYRIEFHDDEDYPANAIRILEGVYDGAGTYVWSTVDPQKHSSYKVVGNDWVKLSGSSETHLAWDDSTCNMTHMDLIDGDNYGITFESKGSIMTTDGSPPADKTIKVVSGDDEYEIYVSIYGTIYE